MLKPGIAVGGVAGAVWADEDNDSYVDGYIYNGQYYAGAPAGYDLTIGRIVPAEGGGAIRAASGAILPGVSVVEDAIIGAAVGGLDGAIWADRDNDGFVDGYIYNGQYYEGAPRAVKPADSGERG